MAKILYVMCGVGFSGKTTLAHELTARKSLQYVSLDQINVERGLGPGGDGLPAEEWKRAMEIAKERIVGLMSAGTSIVVDDTACFRFLRDGYRSLAASHGYRVKIIFVDTPIPRVRRRIRDNRVTETRTGFKDEVFEEHLAGFEPPGGDEDVIVYSGGDIHEWIKREIP